MIHLNTVKPIDKKILIKWAPKVKKIVTIEENVLTGGFGSGVLETLNTFSPKDTYKIERIGLGDKFIDKYGTQEELFKLNKLTKENIIQRLLK